MTTEDFTTYRGFNIGVERTSEYRRDRWGYEYKTFVISGCSCRELGIRFKTLKALRNKIDRINGVK